MMERRQLQVEEPFGLKNMPMRPRERNRLLDTPGTVHVIEDEGEIFLVPDLGQLRLYWGFYDPESMRQAFPGMFDQLREQITPNRADYVAMDLVGLPTREWLKPLMQDADFEFFAEWVDMTNAALDPDAVPEFPEGTSIRRAGDGDFERCREIWTGAHGEYVDGPRTFDAMLEASSWTGVLEEGDRIVGFAINGHVDRAEGQVLTSTVDADVRDKGYGQALLAAAVYQLATQEARRATIRVRPDVPQALRTCTESGFRMTRGGLEYRRLADQAELDRIREERRVVGVKARFGRWR